LNQAVSHIPFGIALKTNPYMAIAKVILGILSVVADLLLTSLISVKEGTATLLEYKPNWLRTLSTEERENRSVAMRNRIKRGTADAKIAWLTKFGDPDIYLAKIRNQEMDFHGPKE